MVYINKIVLLIIYYVWCIFLNINSLSCEKRRKMEENMMFYLLCRRRKRKKEKRKKSFHFKTLTTHHFPLSLG